MLAKKTDTPLKSQPPEPLFSLSPPLLIWMPASRDTYRMMMRSYGKASACPLLLQNTHRMFQKAHHDCFTLLRCWQKESVCRACCEMENNFEHLKKQQHNFWAKVLQRKLMIYKQAPFLKGKVATSVLKLQKVCSLVFESWWVFFLFKCVSISSMRHQVS